MSESSAAKSEAIAQRLNEIMNGGMLALLTSIGYELELFETLSGLPPATSERVASAAGLNERYVREWLNGMVAAGIVEYAPDSGTYALPPEHAALLTRAAGPDNLAAFIHTVPLLSDRRRDVMAPFRSGGGVPYERYDEFMALWARQNELKFERSLLDQISQVVPDVQQRLESGIDVLEIGCGEGHSLNVMARAFPRSRFLGYDLREDAIAAGRAKAQAQGILNVRFEPRDLVSLNDPGAYDLITAFDVIHDQAHPRAVLRNVANALRPGGTFLMVDIHASSHPHENRDHPAAPFLFGTSLLHCMTVSLAYDGEGLGAMWGEQKARELLAEAGFDHVGVHQVKGDAFNNFYVARSG